MPNRIDAFALAAGIHPCVWKPQTRSPLAAGNRVFITAYKIFGWALHLIAFEDNRARKDIRSARNIRCNCIHAGVRMKTQKPPIVTIADEVHVERPLPRLPISDDASF